MRYNTDLKQFREERQQYKLKIDKAIRETILEDVKRKVKYYNFTIDEVFNNKV